jgi:hypothetical protein
VKRLYCLALGLAASSCALVSNLFIERPPGVPASAERVKGIEAMVAGIAMQDFIRAQIAETEEQGWLAPDGGVLPADPDAGWPQDAVNAHRCANSPSNYEVWLDVDGGTQPRWRVVIWASGRCNKDSYGGGGEYEIDGESFEILHREFYE